MKKVFVVVFISCLFFIQANDVIDYFIPDPNYRYVYSWEDEYPRANEYRDYIITDGNFSDSGTYYLMVREIVEFPGAPLMSYMDTYLR